MKGQTACKMTVGAYADQIQHAKMQDLVFPHSCYLNGVFSKIGSSLHGPLDGNR
jgi:hypothetical protein